MQTMIPEQGGDAMRELGRRWWLLLVVGLLWLWFAWIVLTVDITTVWAVAVFAGVGFIGGGVMQLTLASQVTSWRWLYIVMGILGIVAGIMAFIWPGQTFLVLAAILGWYLLFNGIFDIVQAFAIKGDDDMWWLILISGIAQVLIGFWAVGYAGRSVALLIIWVGATALARGITNIVLAFQVRKFKDIPPTAVAA
jgi:uncharacterized membrane protein HdeD (DUF308 family)